MGEVHCPLGLMCMFDTMTPHTLPRERAHHIPCPHHSLRGILRDSSVHLADKSSSDLPVTGDCSQGKRRDAFQQQDDLSSNTGHST